MLTDAARAVPTEAFTPFVITTPARIDAEKAFVYAGVHIVGA